MSYEPQALNSDNDAVIQVQGLQKCFQIYNSPGQRLRQFLQPRVQRWLGRDVQRYYREFWALRDVSFEIRKGQTVGIIGRNGSGKSTLLQMICGTLHPTAGHVEVRGRVAALLELGSGFNPEFTGRENVFFNAGVLGQSEERTREKFADIEAFADIGEFMDQPVKTYSSGMLVRLAFAVIAHVDADILVIDEALAVGDAFFTQKCMRFLRSFMQQGTVLFVSHDTAAVKSLCDKVIWIEKGQLVESGPAKEVCDLYLQAFYEEQQGKSAGVRTHMMVAIGAALFVLIPQQAGASSADLSRILQGLIAGVGFLGTGAIIMGNREVETRGLTTAASIWVTAAIGVAAGMGRETTAVLSTLIALLILSVVPWIYRTKNQNKE